VVELARLIKGYGSTHRRGLSNFGLIVDTYVIPLLNDPGLLDGASSRIKEAREAALADPEGEALKMVLEDNGQREDALAAE
jgi:indolepyruvate ferredoxin oxidoreductase beta subunit